MEERVVRESMNEDGMVIGYGVVMGGGRQRRWTGRRLVGGFGPSCWEGVGFRGVCVWCYGTHQLVVFIQHSLAHSLLIFLAPLLQCVRNSHKQKLWIMDILVWIKLSLLRYSSHKSHGRTRNRLMSIGDTARKVPLYAAPTSANPADVIFKTHPGTCAVHLLRLVNR